MGNSVRAICVYAACALVTAATPALGAQASFAGASPLATCETTPSGERMCSSHHSITMSGRVLEYEATAGTLITRDRAGHPRQSIFFVAYTLDSNRSGPRRPLTFLFNGGPGASSVFLDMVSFGPVRLRTISTGFLPPAPYIVRPNPDTLLGVTDLVFMDAPNSGYSRPLGTAKPSMYYSTDGDAEIFASAIRRYLTKYDRWNSRKFLYGESYGTARAAAVAYRLQELDVSINGVILQSSALNLSRLFGDGDVNYVADLPSFAAVAWYHDRIPGKRPLQLRKFVSQAEEFAVGRYASALSQGDYIDPTEFEKVAEELRHFTGLPLDYIRRAKLRVSVDGFREELLRDQGESVGLLDGRIMAPEADENAEEPSFDASYTAVSDGIYAAFMQYLTDELGYRWGRDYNIAAQWKGPLHWDYAHAAPDGTKELVADVSVDLAAALRSEPFLRVLSLNGWYDLDTPFFGTEMDLSHMMLAQAARERVVVKFYPAGHMGYTDQAALHLMQQDVSEFMEGACDRCGRPR